MKTRPGTDCSSDHEPLIAKIRLKLKKVGKTTMSFWYDLSQILYDYTVQFSCSVISNPFVTPWTEHAKLPCPSSSPGTCLNSFPLSWWCHPAISFSVVHLYFCLQSFPSIGVFSNDSALLIRWPKCWSFSFSISPSKEYSGLISFRMDWSDLFVVEWQIDSRDYVW